MEKIQILIVEDSADDADLIFFELKKNQFDVKYAIVNTKQEMLLKLQNETWDVIISDYKIGHDFNGMDALLTTKKMYPQIPFILISGTIGEEKAVEIMKAGAHDFILKDNLIRLAPIIQREILEIKNIRKNEMVLHEREEQLRQAQKMEAIGVLVGNIAHEINNPLTIISGNVFFLKKMARKGEFDTNLFKEYVENIGETVQRISKIMQGLLSFARKDESEDFRSESVKNIIEQTIILCYEKFKNNGITFAQSPLDDNLMIECRPIQISQVILNLLNNAYDAIKVLTERWINLEVVDLDEWIEIKVTDSGKGIPINIRDKIMEPFFTSKKRGEGTGLGLSVSVGMIGAHAGEFLLNSECPNTQFIIRLPKLQNKKKDDIQ